MIEKFYLNYENSGRLLNEFETRGFTEYSNMFRQAIASNSVQKTLSFKAEESEFPPNMSYGDMVAYNRSVPNIVYLQIITTDAENRFDIARVCRENCELYLPMYLIRQELIDNIKSYHDQLAGIEDTIYMADLKLARTKAVLEKLELANSRQSGKLPSEVIIQFDNAQNSSGYLPLAYQIQAKLSQIIDIEDQIQKNNEHLNYYSQLLNKANTLLAYVENPEIKDKTIEQYILYVSNMLEDTKDDESIAFLTDYLGAYLKRIKKTQMSYLPVIDHPNSYATASGGSKKLAAVFGFFFVIALFLSPLIKGRS